MVQRLLQKNHLKLHLHLHLAWQTAHEDESASGDETERSGSCCILNASKKKRPSLPNTSSRPKKKRLKWRSQEGDEYITNGLNRCHIQDTQFCIASGVWVRDDGAQGRFEEKCVKPSVDANLAIVELLSLTSTDYPGSRMRLHLMEIRWRSQELFYQHANLVIEILRTYLLHNNPCVGPGTAPMGSELLLLKSLLTLLSGRRPPASYELLRQRSIQKVRQTRKACIMNPRRALRCAHISNCTEHETIPAARLQFSLHNLPTLSSNLSSPASIAPVPSISLESLAGCCTSIRYSRSWDLMALPEHPCRTTLVQPIPHDPHSRDPGTFAHHIADRPAHFSSQTVKGAPNSSYEDFVFRVQSQNSSASTEKDMHHSHTSRLGNLRRIDLWLGERELRFMHATPRQKRKILGAPTVTRWRVPKTR